MRHSTGVELDMPQPVVAGFLPDSNFSSGEIAFPGKGEAIFGAVARSECFATK